MVSWHTVCAAYPLCSVRVEELKLAATPALPPWMTQHVRTAVVLLLLQ